MGLLTMPAQFAARILRRGASDTRARSPLLLDESARIYGPATDTETTPPDDGLALLEARRLALITEARRLKCLRKSKAASICERDLRDVTHAILWRRMAAENSPKRNPSC